jgi:hypothetical protein
VAGFGVFLAGLAGVSSHSKAVGAVRLSFFLNKSISVYEDLFVTVSLMDDYSSCFTCVF